MNIINEIHPISYVRYTLDKDSYIIKVDDSFTELTGYTREDIKRRRLSQGDLIPKRNREMYYAMIAEQLRKNQMAYFEHNLLRKDGREISVVCMGRRHFDFTAGEVRSEILVFDIKKTNAADRIYKIEKERAEKRLLDNNIRTVLLMIDIDNFKEYNDSYGHRNGDEFLIVTADAIDDSLRSADVSGRLGGDEFAAAMFFPADTSDDVIRKSVQETFEAISTKINVVKNGTTVSMGAAVSNERVASFTALYDAADAALYDSKDGGKNRISW